MVFDFQGLSAKSRIYIYVILNDQSLFSFLSRFLIEKNSLLKVTFQEEWS